MMCPNCGNEKTVVWDTRYDNAEFDGALYGTVMRRRKCSECGHRMVSCEVIMPKGMTLQMFVMSSLYANHVLTQRQEQLINNDKNWGDGWSTPNTLVEKMRELRATPMSYGDISDACGVCSTTARKYTMDVPLTREQRKSLLKKSRNAKVSENRYKLHMRGNGGDSD